MSYLNCHNQRVIYVIIHMKIIQAILEHMANRVTLLMSVLVVQFPATMICQATKGLPQKVTKT